MTTAIYIIIFSSQKWWIDLEGQSQGPFHALETAMAEAVAIAANTARNGRRSEVQVSAPGAKTRIIYQSPSRGALGRAALANS